MIFPNAQPKLAALPEELQENIAAGRVVCLMPIPVPDGSPAGRHGELCLRSFYRKYGKNNVVTDTSESHSVNGVPGILRVYVYAEALQAGEEVEKLANQSSLHP